MVRRLLPVFVLALFLFAVPAALAAPSPTQTAAHQSGLNTESGVGGPDSTAPAGATPEESVANQFPENTVETFRFEVQPGEENSSFTVEIGWPDPPIDFDIFVYRIRDNGTLVPENIANAATAADPEFVHFTPSLSDAAVPQDEYIVAVHNWCSSEDDPIPVSQDDPDTPQNENTCAGLADQPDDQEDQWTAEVTFTAFDPANKLPSVSLAGPTTATTGQSLTYTASASDPDPNGQITNVAFDRDGDGSFETAAFGALTTTTSFATAGLYAVGVRVVDNEGGVGYASVNVRVTGAPTPPATNAKVRLLSSFKLNRPVFGGRKRNKLVVRYRLREAGRAIVSLYRGKKRVKRLSSGNRAANRTYRINISPNKLRKGATYTVRLSVRSADGKRTQSVRLSAKRL